MEQIILGTAGHIDHGKTSLIRAATGIDTDRLKEEKRRGITIELGFASIDLPNGRHIGIVDVPGHEKFVKNMVAGATGIDLVAMVIAADEGVMPQTREHMEICVLLGIQFGLVVLTKIDMVDEEWLELVTEDIRDFVRGTFLENAPIVPVSSATGEGIDAFVAALGQISEALPERPVSSVFRLPVDRVFSMRGFGTVITGTLISGRISVGDVVEIYPTGITSKVRGIQVHNAGVETAAAGMRTAINFQGLEKEAVMRGDVVSTPGALKPSYMVDIFFHYLESNKKRLKNRSYIRFHAGTSEILGLLILLDREELKPGEDVMAQLRLEKPAALVKEDRFVIRSYSPIRTIGGGRVVNPIPAKHKRFRKNVIDSLKTTGELPPEALVPFLSAGSGYEGVSFADLKIMTNLHEKKLGEILSKLLSQKTLIQIDKENQTYIHQDNLSRLKNEILHHLEQYHAAYPLKQGINREELKSKFPRGLGPKLFNLALTGMMGDNWVAQEDETVRLASHKISLGTDQTRIREKIIRTYTENGLTPPYFKELIKLLDIDPSTAKDVLRLLVDEGVIVKTKEDLFFSAEVLRALERRLVDHLTAHEEMTTPEFKEMTGVSRKYLIPLLEHFDTHNITIRVGDVRRLRKKR